MLQEMIDMINMQANAGQKEIMQANAGQEETMQDDKLPWFDWIV